MGAKGATRMQRKHIKLQEFSNSVPYDQGRQTKKVSAYALQ